MDIWLDAPSAVEAVLPRRVVLPSERSLTLGSSLSDIVYWQMFRYQHEVGRDRCGAWISARMGRVGISVNERKIGGGSIARLLPNDRIRVADFQMRVGWDFEVDPYWLRWEEGVIVALARRALEEWNFAAMPILADALEDAGCTEATVLEHLRGPGPHVGECWIIDAILNVAKEPRT